MVAFNKLNQFGRDLVAGVHNFDGHTFKIMLSNTAPTSASAVKADITEISAGSGYTAGGSATTITVTNSSGLIKISGTDVEFTSSGTVGPFRYPVLYNTSASGQPLVGWWDYGSQITLNNGDKVTVRFDASNGILTVS